MGCRQARRVGRHTRLFGVREELAGAFRMPSSQVRVIVPDFGSGYGGKHTGEVAVEAARLAKAAGAPVKVVWTRAAEFQCHGVRDRETCTAVGIRGWYSS